MPISAAEKALVRERAAERCEYCKSRQEDHPWSRFHVEHIIAKKHHGRDDVQNLCLCCQHCNLHKGPNLAGLDQESGVLTRLFNPRTDSWDEHFVREGTSIKGLTPLGRVTVDVLAMNAETEQSLRSWLD